MVKPVQPTKINPSDIFSFEPKQDITPYEIALILKLITVTCTHDFMKKLPADMHRHFVGRPRQDLAPNRRR